MLAETNNSIGDTSSESLGYVQGGIGADNLIVDFSYDTSVVSGNGNLDYGAGVYDTLNMNNLSVNDVFSSSYAEDGGGVLFNPGDGERVFDRFVLDNGVNVFFEGIERIVFADQTIDLTVNPDDPLFAQQWNLHMMGVHTAWRMTTGTEDVLLGVQDTGLGADINNSIHQDLKPEETFIVTDGSNNFADDFGDERTRILREIGVITDPAQSHGTLVQGVIAAQANNGEGIAGINWNSDVANIDVLEENSTDLSLAGATQTMIDQATRGGQKLVINMSLESGFFDEDLERLIAANQEDVLFVVATGNGYQEQLANPNITTPGIASPAVYAQTYGNVIAVGAVLGATNEAFQPLSAPVVPGTIADYSNRGEGITLVGPTNVLSTNSTEGIPFDYSPGFNGTSAATPNVAGAASLVWSANNNLDASQVRGILANTASDLGSPGYDLTYGSGLVNADAAVRNAIAIGRRNPFPASISDAISTVNSFNAAEDNANNNVNFAPASLESSSDHNLGSDQSDLPTSLFNYQAPELQKVAGTEGEVSSDLYSSPLYQSAA